MNDAVRGWILDNAAFGKSAFELAEELKKQPQVAVDIFDKGQHYVRYLKTDGPLWAKLGAQGPVSPEDIVAVLRERGYDA